jgi:hypothetical protein
MEYDFQGEVIKAPLASILLSLRSFPQREAIHEDTQEAPLAFPVPLK